jgi:hypothetical protein
VRTKDNKPSGDDDDDEGAPMRYKKYLFGGIN